LAPIVLFLALISPFVFRIVSDRGFAFITPDDGGEDIFFHASGMARRDTFDDVREGDQVEFRVGYDDRSRKERATDVEVIGGGGGGGGGGRSRSRSRGGRGGGRR